MYPLNKFLFKIHHTVWDKARNKGWDRERQASEMNLAPAMDRCSNFSVSSPRFAIVTFFFSFSSHSARCAEYPPVSTLLHIQLRAHGPLFLSMSLKSLALLSLHSIPPERDTHPLPFFVPGPLQWGSPQKQLLLQLCSLSFVKHSISSQTSSSVFQSLKNAPGTPETPICLQKLCLQKLPLTSLTSFMTFSGVHCDSTG